MLLPTRLLYFKSEKDFKDKKDPRTINVADINRAVRSRRSALSNTLI